MKKDLQDEKISTSNIVGLTKIAYELDLEKLYVELENISYEPEQFSGLIYRNKDPNGTITLFTSGKIIRTGADSKAYAK